MTVLTCHGLAMRLAGASFGEGAERPDGEVFKEVLRRAIALLRGEGLPPEEADERRERLLAGFRWILVDEYQDIDADQYELISALAGRTLEEEDRKLTLFAVGDDDQNVYAFKGASVEFIRRFERDYGPKPVFLIDNYRSTAHIVAAANAVIEPARHRMKTGYPIRVDRARAKESPGGAWGERDTVTQGRVRILPTRRDPIAQARAAMAELVRLASLAPDWDWSKCAVIAREWKYLEPVRALCEVHRIPVQMGDEEIPRFRLLRETREMVEWLRGARPPLVRGTELRAWVDTQPPGPWIELLREALDEHALEVGEDPEVPVGHFIEWLAEWGRDVRRRQRGLMLLTAHRAKGLEFDHVAVLDGGWERRSRGEDADAPRRLYYVAMTRARQTLALTRFGDRQELERPNFVGEPAAPRLRGAFPPAATCLSRWRCIPASQPRRRPAGSPGTRSPVSAARSGRRLPELRGTLPPPASGAPRHRRPFPGRSAGSARGRTRPLEPSGRVRDRGRPSRGELRASSRDAPRLRHRFSPSSLGAAKRRSPGTAQASGATLGRW